MHDKKRLFVNIVAIAKNIEFKLVGRYISLESNFMWYYLRIYTSSLCM